MVSSVSPRGVVHRPVKVLRVTFPTRQAAGCVAGGSAYTLCVRLHLDVDKSNLLREMAMADSEFYQQI